MHDKQSMIMKWVLFWVFVTTFVLAVLGTLGMIFFGFGTPTPDERAILVKAFLVEIAAAVTLLFYSMFNLKKSPNDTRAIEDNLKGIDKEKLQSLSDAIIELQNENELLKGKIAYHDSLKTKVYAISVRDRIFTVDLISKELFQNGYDQQDRGHVLSIIGELVKEGVIEGAPANEGQGYKFVRKY